VAHVVDNGGDALVRMKVTGFVLRSAEGKRLRAIAREISDLATRA
jgi:hypothetical protein